MAIFAHISSVAFIILCLSCISSSLSDVQNRYPPGSLACKTYNMTDMDCSNRFLVDIPVLDQILTTTLDLSQNQLTQIKGAPFEQLSDLQLLSLSYNDISYLSSTAFRGLWLLEELVLEFNKNRSTTLGHIL